MRTTRLARRAIVTTIAALPLHLAASSASSDGSLTIQVTIASPGTPAERAEKDVAIPIERELARLKNTSDVRSTSSPGACALEGTFTGIAESDAISRVRYALQRVAPAYHDAKVRVRGAT